MLLHFVGKFVSFYRLSLNYVNFLQQAVYGEVQSPRKGNRPGQLEFFCTSGHLHEIPTKSICWKTPADNIRYFIGCRLVRYERSCQQSETLLEMPAIHGF